MMASLTLNAGFAKVFLPFERTGTKQFNQCQLCDAILKKASSK